MYKPQPTDVYFKNVRRGPLVVIRNALRECLPSWTLPGLKFVGAPVLEIVIDERLSARTTATLRVMGITEITDIDILTNATKNQHNKELQDERLKKNLSTAIHRLQKILQKAPNHWARKSYKGAVTRAAAKLSAPTAHTAQPSAERRNTPLSREARHNDEPGWKKVINRKNTANNNNTVETTDANPDSTDATSKFIAPTEPIRQDLPGTFNNQKTEPQANRPHLIQPKTPPCMTNIKLNGRNETVNGMTIRIMNKGGLKSRLYNIDQMAREVVTLGMSEKWLRS